MDDIFGNFAGYRDEPFWHKKGLTKEGGWPNAVEAVKEIGIDRNVVHVLPVQYTRPDGIQVTSDNRFIILREPIPGIDNEWREFKSVGNKYTFVTPMNIAQILDAEPNPLTKTWPVDTLFLLGKGERFGITLKMESSYPNQDEDEKHEHWLFVHDNFRGSGSLTIMDVEVRVGCQNTVLRAYETGTRKMTFPHMGKPDMMLEFRVGLEKAALQMRQDAVNQFEAMMKWFITEEERKDILMKVFPDPKSTLLDMANSQEAHLLPEGLLKRAEGAIKDARLVYEQIGDRNSAHRVNLMRVFQKFNDEQPKYAETAYAYMQSFAEYADWRTGRGEKNRASQQLFGDRAKEKRLSYKLILNTMMK